MNGAVERPRTPSLRGRRRELPMSGRKHSVLVSSRILDGKKLDVLDTASVSALAQEVANFPTHSPQDVVDPVVHCPQQLWRSSVPHVLSFRFGPPAGLAGVRGQRGRRTTSGASVAPHSIFWERRTRWFCDRRRHSRALAPRIPGLPRRPRPPRRLGDDHVEDVERTSGGGAGPAVTPITLATSLPRSVDSAGSIRPRTP